MNREEILQAATQCVMKDRNATHGEPEDNFQNIADLWNVWVRMKMDRVGDKQEDGSTQLPQVEVNVFFSPTDVAILMTLMKTSRLISSPAMPDHWIDIAGYAACGGGIATKGEA